MKSHQALFVNIPYNPSLKYPPVYSIALDGKAAIVIGASRSLGGDIALKLAGRCIDISITDSSTAIAEGVADEALKQGRIACTAQADLAGQTYGTVIIQVTLKNLQVEKIDILMNNAVVGQQVKLMGGVCHGGVSEVWSLSFFGLRDRCVARPCST